MSWLTTHVLDTQSGTPATGAVVRCERQREGAFVEVARGATDNDGRLRTLFSQTQPVEPGIYRLSFETGAYFAALDQKTFYPEVQIVFEVVGGQSHYHVPLLISPFGYTTYRGS